jgi:dienelactone hydrolase
MKTQNLDYSDGETTLTGILAFDPDKRGRRPGVIVFHEAPGITDHPKRRIATLSDMGYVALAADMFGDGKVIMGPDAMARMQRVQQTPGLMRRRVRAAFDALRARPEVDAARMAAIGFCFGGSCALDLARSGAEIAGIVSFHGVLSTPTPAEAKNIKAKVLIMTGAEDPIVPPEQVAAFEDEMRQGGVKDWQVIVFGGAFHAFMNSDVPAAMAGFAYDPRADARGWRAMQNFFGEIFGAAQ